MYLQYGIPERRCDGRCTIYLSKVCCTQQSGIPKGKKEEVRRGAYVHYIGEEEEEGTTCSTPTLLQQYHQLSVTAIGEKRVRERGMRTSKQLASICAPITLLL